MAIRIRPAELSDVDALFALTAGLIEDHLPGQTPWTSPQAIAQHGFGTQPLFEALIAETDVDPIGFVSFFRGYAGWRGRPMGIVHALYVVPHRRRQGIAKRLMAEVAHLALAREWTRIELFVEEDRSAIAFYESLGMHDLQHRHLRIDGDNLAKLAAEARGMGSGNS
jgi:GNAT superfamily N-acetyltransferase